DGVDGARQLARAKDGTIFVGTRNGKVYALPDRNKDGKADEVIVFAKELNSPNGVTWHKDSLFVGERTRILRYPKANENLKNPPSPLTFHEGLPKDSHHGQRYIKFGPDGWLYTGIGIPCNV